MIEVVQKSLTSKPNPVGLVFLIKSVLLRPL
jgi:hypothetical protein